MKVLVIGYGHPLRSDDYAGVRAVERLRHRPQRAGVVCITVHALYPELAAHIKEAGMVIFVDACADQAPGEIAFRRLSLDRAQTANGALASHHLTPEALLQMTAQLYGHNPKAAAFTIGGGDFAYGQTLSPVVRAHLPALVGRIGSYLSAQLAMAEAE